MCGIAGHWAHSGPELPDSRFRAFVDSLSHRGPDGSGIEHFPADRLWLGHRRLAVIDRSDLGHQPMSYARGRYWLTFNGAIYNFIELRSTLRKRGHRFLSDSDSEVVLAAYAEWGAECQHRFNGMWAFAVWDTIDRKLFLSRDRFGVKPLFYADIDGCFAFASELKSFLHMPWCDGSLDENVMAAAIREVVGQERAARTLLPTVKRLPAGHCMTLSRHGRHITPWWKTEDHLPSPPPVLEDQAERFSELFLNACRLRLRSDASMATSLSGGLDSSAVACAISEIGRSGEVERLPEDWQRAFISCYPNTNLDERHYAEQVARSTGLRAHYLTVDDRLAAEEIEQVIYDLEELWHVPMVGAWAVYREMQRHGLRVSLDGHGADELLGGYHFFVQAAIESQYGMAFRPRRYRDLTRVRGGLSGGTKVGRSGELLGHVGLIDDLRVLAGRRSARIVKSLGFLCRRDSPALLRWASGREGDFVEALLRPRKQDERGPLHPAGRHQRKQRFTVQGMLYEFFHHSVLPTFLRCIDRASMAHGIEVRMPFMDWRLVTFAFALPEESKIGGGYTKRILRMAMAGRMPDRIRLRTAKIHFSAPVSDWSRHGLRPWLNDIAASRAFRESAVWDGTAAREAIERAVAGESPIDTVWPIINAHVLQQRFRKERRSIVRELAGA